MNVLVVEDEPAAARKIIRLLESEARIGAVVGQVDSVESAYAWFEENPMPDLIVSDIELGDGLSFDVFGNLPDCPPIIFVTAYDQYALQAFRVPGLAYILKPARSVDLQQALDKMDSLRTSNSSTGPEPHKLRHAFSSLGRPLAPPKRFLVRMGEKLLALPVQEAAYYFVEDRVVFYMTDEGKRYPLDLSLDDVENMLDESHFFRINRQYIIRDQAITEMHIVSKSRVKLSVQPPQSGDTIVSKERSPIFRSWIQGK